MAQRAPRRIPDFTQSHDPLAHFSLDILVDRFAERIAAAITEALATQKPATRTTPTPLLLNADEAAAYLNVSTSTLNTWSRNGQVTRSQLGKRVRYERTELDHVARHGLRPITQD